MTLVMYCLLYCFTQQSSLTIHSFFFFFNDTATTEIYTLSLHDALPICFVVGFVGGDRCWFHAGRRAARGRHPPGYFALDRKSTRLNSSHSQISYAVFCLKKKKKVVIECSQTY